MTPSKHARPLRDSALIIARVDGGRRRAERDVLAQGEFAGRYHIPIGALRDWERGRSEPDPPARAYLTVIAHDPESCAVL